MSLIKATLKGIIPIDKSRIQVTNVNLADASQTLPVNQLLNYLFTITPAGPVTLTLPSAAEVVSNYVLNNMDVGDALDFVIRNLGAADVTVAPGVGGAVSGTATVAASFYRRFLLRVDSVGPTPTYTAEDVGASSGPAGVVSPWVLTTDSVTGNDSVQENPALPGINFAEDLVFGSTSTEDIGGPSIRRLQLVKVGLSQGSFRAGTATGTQWDAVNRGENSVAFGENCIASGATAVVGGGAFNTASAQTSTVGGGLTNNATGNETTIAGGISNTADSQNATVGGGNANSSLAISATVSGGSGCTASGENSTVGGGNGNTATGLQATVGGGGGNTAGDDDSTVGGGNGNDASGVGSTISGGGGPALGNSAGGAGATVGGGQLNSVAGSNATVPGGSSNNAGGAGSFVCGVGGFDGTNANCFVFNDGVGGLAAAAPTQVVFNAAGEFLINQGAVATMTTLTTTVAPSVGAWNYTTFGGVGVPPGAGAGVTGVVPPAPAVWVGAAPTNVNDAIERLAFAVSAIMGGGIV